MQSQTPMTPDEQGTSSGGGRPPDQSRLLKRTERRAAALSALYFFLLLFGYYLIRPVRETMGISRGADKLPWLMTGTMLAMLLVNPAFGALTARLPRERFIPIVYRFACTNLLVFFILMHETGGPWLIAAQYAFYVWLSVFSLFVVSVFWAFNADVFSAEASRRLFGFVAAGGTLGAIAGAFAASRLTGPCGLDPALMLVLACVPIEAAVRCARRISRRMRRSDLPPDPMTSRSRSAAGSALDGFALLAATPYLQLIAAYVFIFSMTSTFLYREQAKIIESLYSDAGQRTHAFANLDLWTNVLTLLAELFITSRVIRRIGVGGTLCVLPAFTVFGFLLLLSTPGLTALMIFQVVRRAMHYALDRPARETLFTVLSPAAKYQSKSVIDTFIYRSGDQLGIWLPGWLESAAIAVPAVAAPLAAIWVVVAMVLGRMQARRASASATGDIPAIE